MKIFILLVAFLVGNSTSNKYKRNLNPESLSKLDNAGLSIGSVTFSSYMSYEEQMAYLRRLAYDFPDIVTVSPIGQSYEGRDLLLLRLSSGLNPDSSPKPRIFIDAGIHSTEWIGPCVALYIIHQLVENSSNAPMFQNIDWYILPNLNPDGYEYTQRENRLWRKNRRPEPGAACPGTDLNRNFGYFWMYDGASNDTCDWMYGGPREFSEPESQALRDWFLENGSEVKLFLSFHSFGELILYPWGCNESYPQNAGELQELGEKAAAAISEASTINSSYVTNSSANGIYIAAGISIDWVMAEVGVDLTYVIELPEADSPFHFMLPARQILPIAKETWEGVKVFFNHIQEKFVDSLSARK